MIVTLRDIRGQKKEVPQFWEAGYRSLQERCSWTLPADEDVVPRDPAHADLARQFRIAPSRTVPDLFERFDYGLSVHVTNTNTPRHDLSTGGR